MGLSARSGESPFGGTRLKGRGGPGQTIEGHVAAQAMPYEVTAICDGCGARQSFSVEVFGDRFPYRPLPRGWTHVHRGGEPGTVTPETGIACSRACLSKARALLIARSPPARAPGRRRNSPRSHP